KPVQARHELAAVTQAAVDHLRRARRRAVLHLGDLPRARAGNTLSSRSTLKPNADGSTDRYIQKDSPGPDKESNWLPAPPGRFVLMLRLYWPREADPSILKGTWKPPAVKPVG
ncbi:MAG TPA: DUF1214 domain-containing protein, partial [Candidatus Binatia bacterium]|nr:DUF1214 domain-containing protein [Candidatus Binatia bacterium]